MQDMNNPTPYRGFIDFRAVYFTDANIGYAVNIYGLIIKTSDGGTNWKEQSKGVTNWLESVHFPDANTGYAVGEYGAILKTTNGGSNWLSQTSGTNNWLNSVYFANASTGYIVGKSGLILKTANGGTKWNTQTSGISSDLTSVYFTNTTTGYAVGNNGVILKTTNGGSNWTLQASGTSIKLNSVYFINANVGYIVGQEETILKTSNGGLNWIAQSSGSTYYDLNSVYFSDANTGYAVGVIGRIIKTIDGGTNWIEQTTNVVDDLKSVYFIDTNRGYAAGQWGTILATVNGGSNWIPQASVTNTELKSIFFTDANTGYAVGIGGAIIKKNNGTAPVLAVSSNKITIAAPAYSTQTFGITSTVNWTATSNQSWLTLNKTSGSVNTTVTMAAELNPTSASRTAMVTVAGTGVTSEIITVTQTAAGSLFTEQTGISLTGIMHASTAWGDYDNDGDLDILLTGVTGLNNSNPVTKIYRNNGNNTFTEQTTIVLPGIYTGTASWGDFDNDGFLDVLLVGNAGSDFSPNSISKIYRNNGNNTFTEQTGITLKGVRQGSAAWGDYNNDGLQDILLMGTTGTEIVTTIYRNNGNNSFSEQTNISLTKEYDGSVAWGDYDNDGNLDILISGYTGNTYRSKIYRNNGNNTFTEQTGILLNGLNQCSVAWGDYDGDGDLDILMSGFSGTQGVVNVYRNNGNNSFTALTGISFPVISSCSVAWGDYDNDGDQDILLTGDDNISGITRIYQNQGSDSFIEETNATLTGVIEGSAVWGDYDNDGKLDILLTGLTGAGYMSRIYKNNGSVSNSIPSTPSNLQATPNSSDVILKWNKSTDGQTTQNGLTYNLYVYENGQTNCKVAPQAFKQADVKNGLRLVAQMGSIQYNSNGYTIKGLPNGHYIWSVQAIDAGLKGGKFATENAFTIGGIVPILSVSTQSLNLNANTDTTASFSITSNISWNVSSDQTWLTVNNSSGSNNATITLVASTNSSTLIRTATVTVSGTSVPSKTITVTQNGAATMMTMTTAKPLGATISFSLMANVANTPVKVDFGNGTLVSQMIGTSEAVISGNLVGSQTIKIYGSGITYLSCFNSQLTALDVSSNGSLSELACSYNQLTSLDLTQSTALTYLHCGNNQLTSLDVTRNTSLSFLKCYFNQLASLDVSVNTALKTIDCSNNQITTLDVTKNTGLIYFYCSYNKLTTLDISRNIALTTFSCNSNQLTTLDVTKNTVLSFFDCKDNQLSTLDVSGNRNLSMLFCKDNQLVFSSLPFYQASWTTYSYAPQHSIPIKKKLESGDEVDLSSHLMVKGNSTLYKWKTTGGKTLTEGSDYIITFGKTIFLAGQADSMYCEMTNVTFPDFSGTSVFKTTRTSLKLNTATDDLKKSEVEIYSYQKTLHINLDYNAQLSLFDLSGRLVLSGSINSGENTVQLQYGGIYLVKITGNKGTVTRKVYVE